MRPAPLLVVLAATLSLAGVAWAGPAPDAEPPPTIPSASPAPLPTRAGPPVVVWPTLTPIGDGASAVSLHKPQAVADREVFEHAQELDATLRDAVQDLGFTLYVADDGPAPGHTRDEDLIERAGRAAVAVGDAPEGGTWVISPRLEPATGGAFTVRIVAVAPQGHELRVRVETAPADSVGVRGLVMLRDLLSPTTAAQAAIESERERTSGGSTRGIMSPLRSQGRAVLAVNSGLFGGFAAYSLQRASGSDDPRVLYPLLALGTAVGVGAALLAADEWNVTPGDAWVLSAGGWWGAGAGFLISAGHGLQPADDRFAWGAGGGLIGTGLATFALTRTSMDEGDAMLTHSGGALGLVLGGAVQLLLQGQTLTYVRPYLGAGYGTAVGVVAAGVLATQVTVSPSRVLLIDLGVGSGALLGAALGSPLIFKDLAEARTRAWFAASIGGSVVGGVAAWWLTRESAAAAAAKKVAWRYGSPNAGVLGASETPRGPTPIYGLSWSGAF
jgi:hypothetical protein